MPLRVGGRPNVASWSTTRVWLAGFLVFFGLSAAWALASPLTAVPDEPAHMVKAAATARMEFRGKTVDQPTVIDNKGTTKIEQMGGFKVPGGYRQILDLHWCYQQRPNTSAACAAPITAEPGSARVGTAASANNPAYYILVGWPSLLSTGETGLYGMRLVSAAVCSALLAGAVVTMVRQRKHRRILLTGLAAAATPTVLFLNGSVNPNSVEICAGILLWSVALAVFMDPDPALVTRRLNLAAVASVALVCVRALGPLWIAGILICAVVAGERGVLRDLIGRRLVWAWSVVLGVLTLAAFWLTAHYGVVITSNINFPEWTASKAADYTFSHTFSFINQQIGLFGWLDVDPPTAARISFYVGVLTLLALALLFGRWRERLALVCLSSAIVAIPVIAMAKQAQHLGMIWQGRYLLAVAAGLPILIASVIAKHADREDPLRRGLRPVVRPVIAAAAVLFVVVGVMMFYNTLHRYAVGRDQALFPQVPNWTPPGGLLPTTGLYLAAAIGLLALLWAAGRTPDDRPAGPGAGGSGTTVDADPADHLTAVPARIVLPHGRKPESEKSGVLVSAMEAAPVRASAPAAASASSPAPPRTAAAPRS